MVAPLANVLFDRESQGVYGGSEIRAWTFARGLAKSGFDASIVVHGDGRSMPVQESGVRVHRYDFGAAPAPAGKLARLINRIRGKREDELSLFLRSCDAQIVCGFGAVSFNAQLGEICRRQGGKMALFLGSDIDVAGTLGDILAGRALADLPPREEARAALAAADLVVAQTEWQARRVQAITGRASHVVRNPVDLTGPAPLKREARCEVLWVGKTDDIKRPALALEAARLCPEQRFRVVANPTREQAWNELQQTAPSNVELVRRFAYDRRDETFGRALVLLNTSVFEGFPNAFLQAGRCGVPIVSVAADPDAFLERTGSGIVTGEDPKQIAAAIRMLASDLAQWSARSAAIQDYVKSNHEAAACVSRLATCLGELVAGDRGKRASSLTA